MNRIIFFAWIVFSSCSEPGATTGFTKNSLEGNWTPTAIDWQIAVPGDPELGKTRYASFYTLSFKGSEFLMIGSTNSPGDNDTLLIGTEPGHNLYHGTWNRRDSSLVINYRKVYSFLELPGDMLFAKQTDTLTLQNGAFAFDNKVYRRNVNIDSNKINSFWEQAGSIH